MYGGETGFIRLTQESIYGDITDDYPTGLLCYCTNRSLNVSLNVNRRRTKRLVGTEIKRPWSYLIHSEALIAAACQ